MKKQKIVFQTAIIIDNAKFPMIPPKEVEFEAKRILGAYCEAGFKALKIHLAQTNQERKTVKAGDRK